MNDTNPFNVSFGEPPINLISRNNDFNTIIDTFNNTNPESKSYIITGPRGSGKTILLSLIKKYYDSEQNWITVDLNPYESMAEQLAAKIYDKGKVNKLFLKSEFSFSFQGISFSLKGENPVTNVQSLLELIFKYLKNKNIKVLITIDDVSNSDNMRSFIYTYQELIREGYFCFILMSGLYENVYNLENEKSLTFLSRSPKLILNPLSLREISISYKNLLKLNDVESIKLSKLTKGYAYGFQLLGSLVYKNGSLNNIEEILQQYDIKLQENVYGKIWEKLSYKEKEILKAISSTQSLKTGDILKQNNLKNNLYQVYRNRLINKGLINNTKGKIEFSLPRFKEFVLFEKEMEEI